MITGLTERSEMHAEKKLVLENHCIMEKFKNVLVENIMAQILFNILYIRPVESSDGDAIYIYIYIERERERERVY